jgi:hypothetical protein
VRGGWAQPEEERSQDFHSALMLVDVHDLTLENFIGDSTDPAHWPAVAEKPLSP